MSDSKDKPATQEQQISVVTPEGMRRVFANGGFIIHGEGEFFLDLFLRLPRQDQAAVVAQIAMAPLFAKRLMKTMQINIANFEARYGEIRMEDGAAVVFDAGN